MFLSSIQTVVCSKVISVSGFVRASKVTSGIYLSLSCYECIFHLPSSALSYASGHAKEALDLARMQEQTSHLEYQSKIKVPHNSPNSANGCKRKELVVHVFSSILCFAPSSGIWSSRWAAERRPNTYPGWGEEENAEWGDQTESSGESRCLFNYTLKWQLGC